MTGEYERVQITGWLKCLSPLSIGTGAMPGDISGREGQHGNYLDICTHPDGTPFIPGTSLRGLLSALLGKPKDKNDQSSRAELHRSIFGEMRGGQHGNNDKSKTGLLRVYDANLCQAGDCGQPKIDRTRTAIDPITGTAEDNSLHKIAQVPVNSEFRCEFEFERRGKERINRADVVSFLGLLNQLNPKNPQSRLGRGGNKSEGRVVWSLESVKTLRSDDLAAWLLDAKPSLGECYRDETKAVKSATIKFDDTHENFQRLYLRLNLQGPLLVDAEEIEEIINGKPRKISHYRYVTRDGQTYLIAPAASLRGLLRSHCRKILMTLLVDKLKENPPYKQARKLADQLIGQLFGCEKLASAISLEDAVGPDIQPHRQSFIALDRFTGGVATTALFNVKASYKGSMQTSICIDPRRIDMQQEWWKGLLLLALRDAMEGDMALGWGKSKGYGVFTLNIGQKKNEETIPDWNAFLLSDKYPGQAMQWVFALHTELTQLIKK